MIFGISRFSRRSCHANRLLSKLALLEKICNFCVDFLKNFESVCEHTVEKFSKKDAKKGNFSKQMKFRKKSNERLA